MGSWGFDLIYLVVCVWENAPARLVLSSSASSLRSSRILTRLAGVI